MILGRGQTASARHRPGSETGHSGESPNKRQMNRTAASPPSAGRHRDAAAGEEIQVNNGVRRILIVDDHRDAVAGLALLVTMGGHEARTAADGLAALDVARIFHPEIILLDIGLPKKDGYEVARELRREHGEAVLLVAITGYDREEDRRRAREAGFDHLLVKPVTAEALRPFLVGSESWQRIRQEGIVT